MSESMIREYAEWLAGQESEAESLAGKGRDEDAEYNTGRAEAYGTALARLERIARMGKTDGETIIDGDTLRCPECGEEICDPLSDWMLGDGDTRTFDCPYCGTPTRVTAHVKTSYTTRTGKERR